MDIKKIDKNEIIEQIKAKGYVGKAISYAELQELHKKYGRGMTEVDFAQDILDITYPSYSSCKNRDKKVKILKSEIEQLTDEEIRKRVEGLKEKGYVGKAINYQELQKLYKKYGKGTAEVDFAQKILGITYASYNKIKNTENSRAIILKSEIEELTHEEISSIVEQLKKAGYVGKLITFEELQTLYKKYGAGMSKVDFAQKILGVRSSSYRTSKSKGSKVKILKTEIKKILDKERRKRVEQLKEKGYEGKLITYEELQKLHQEYGAEISEMDFAQNILGLTYSNYRNALDRNSQVTILSRDVEKLTDEERRSIVDKLKEDGYVGKPITYEEFQKLYQKYGEGMTEIDFVQDILDISCINYKSCKNQGTRMVILKSEVEKVTKKVADKKRLSEKDKRNIIEKVKENGYAGSLITYEELQKLHQEYGAGMTEVDFAQDILGVGYGNYSTCKIRGTRVNVLKSEVVRISEEEKGKIIKEITQKGYIGKRISYPELQALHQEYGKEMSEADFAQNILGITYPNYNACKHRGQNIIPKDPIAFAKAKEIKELYINNPGYYSKDDIQAICKEYNMTPEQFVTYVVMNGFYDSAQWLDILEKRGKLWIGKTRLSPEFTNKNVENIERMASMIANSLCVKYKIKNRNEDYKQDLIIYIIENTGFYEKNLEDNIDEYNKIVYGITRRYCEGTIVKHLKKSSKSEGFTKLRRKWKEEGEFEVQYADKNVDVAEEVVQRQKSKTVSENDMDECINLLKEFIEDGLEKSEAIKQTALKMNIDENKMLECMQQYLLTRGKVKVRKSGKIEFSDEDTVREK